MKTRVLLLILILSGVAQAVTPWERYSITQAIGKGAWETSEQLFRKLKESDLPPDQLAQVDYNLGLALYNQEKFEEALPLFETAGKVESDALKAKALYNQGNTLFKMDRLDEAKTAFEKALLTNPEDDDARHNIEVILDKQQQQKNQQNQQDQKNDKSDKQDDRKDQQSEQQDQGDSDQQEQKQDKQDQKDGEHQEQQSGQDQKEQDGKPQEMSAEEKRKAQEEAERARLLDYFKQQERDGRPATQVRAQSPPVSGKTW